MRVPTRFRSIAEEEQTTSEWETDLKTNLENPGNMSESEENNEFHRLMMVRI